MAWNPNTYRPEIRKQGDTTYRPFWEGGTMVRTSVFPETTVRVGVDARRVAYNPFGGRKVYRFAYSFRRMPAFYRNQLDTWFGWNKDSAATKGLPLELRPHLIEAGAGDLTMYTVDIVDSAINAAPEFGPRQQLLGFTGSLTFESHTGG